LIRGEFDELIQILVDDSVRELYQVNLSADDDPLAFHVHIHGLEMDLPFEISLQSN
jgi:hypothetical protein